MFSIKHNIKKILAAFGFYHPSLGIKIPPQQKAAIILEHKMSHIKTLVETGTYQGWMIETMEKEFSEIYSIELGHDLYEKAVEKFKGNNRIIILNGDSAVEIKRILTEISQPSLFWLDAHGSGTITAGNSPIIKELEAIFAHPVKDHVILIDDARHFDIATIKKMKKMSKSSNYTFIIKDGIFRLNGR